MSMFSTTGVWADTDPREAVSRGVSALEGEHSDMADLQHSSALAFPLMGQPAAGGTRWAADALGFAAQLLPELPVDIGPAGWRLLGARAATASRALDSRREASRLGQAVDALSEYAERSNMPVMVSVPGPWTLVRQLGLPDESPVLGDLGARRDVIQSYAAGLLELRERLQKVVAGGVARPTSAANAGTTEHPGSAAHSDVGANRPAANRTAANRTAANPTAADPNAANPHGEHDPAPLIRIRLVENSLDDVLTGTVPTVSGYRTLPAVPDAHVTTALRSLVARTGPHTVLSLPHASSVLLRGKTITHTQLAQEAGVRALAVGGLGDSLGTGSTGPERTHAGRNRGTAGSARTARTARSNTAQNLANAQTAQSTQTALAVRRWEKLAEWSEQGRQLWLRIPPHAASSPEAVNTWVDAVRRPWEAVGMARRDLASFGILTGEELPLCAEPLLPEAASADRSRAHLRMGQALARAFTDQAG